MKATPRVFVGSGTVRVPDDGCGHCLATASVAVAQLPGVRSTDVDRVARTVTVQAADPVDLADVVAAVELTGHACAPAG